MKKPDPPTVIDLFCGIGGASLGFKQVGYDIRLGLDIEQKACEIYSKNIEAKEVVQDINDYSPEQCLVDSDIADGELDVLICCPPCQGFSRIRKNGESDHRNDLVKTTAEFVLTLKPKVLIFENVPGILTEKYRENLNYFVSVLKNNNYLFSSKLQEKYLLNTADYGVPQSRKRFILIAVNNQFRDEEISSPKKTHCKVNDDLKKWKTVHDAISDLKSLKSGEEDTETTYHIAPKHTERIVKMIEQIRKNGGSRINLPDEFVLDCHKDFNGHQDVYGIMEWEKPAPTLTAGWHTPSKGRFIHPRDNRGLTIREACRLQTFPDNFDFSCASKLQTAIYIGNAVPVELMRIIATHIAKEMNWMEKLDQSNNISFWDSISK